MKRESTQPALTFLLHLRLIITYPPNEIRNTQYEMFHSIRWRLILSYTALTLLTVVLVGALALGLLRQYAQRRAEQSLQANAQAIAAQAQPLLAQPITRLMELERLAATAAFLGNVRVRILNGDGQLLVDSNDVPAGASLSLRPQSFLFPETGFTFAPQSMNRRGMMPTFGEGMIITEEVGMTDGVTGGVIDGVTGIVTIHRFPGMFGSRLEFNGGQPDQSPAWHDSQRNERPPRQVWQFIYGEGETPPPLPISELAVNLPVGDPAAPDGFVELSGGPDFVSESLRNVRRSFGVAGLGVGLLAVIVGLLVSRGLTAPITALGDAARRMGEGDLSARAAVQSSDEIGQVAAHFNRMADGLQASFAELEAERDALRRFVADASHELRTPITALKSFNELLIGPAAHDPAAQAEFLAESAVQVERLEWITANLLDLSRLDGRLVALDLAEHDISDLLEEAAAPFRGLAAEQGIELSLRHPDPPLTLSCDQPRLLLALSNLLDNGLKYCAPGDRVEIGGEESNGAIRLWVADTGPGIDEAVRPHIFERFYRGRTHRENGAEISGSGLGLSIVASVVQAHGWKIRVESGAGSGSEDGIREGTKFVIEVEEGGADNRSPLLLKCAQRAGRDQAVVGATSGSDFHSPIVRFSLSKAIPINTIGLPLAR